MLVPVTLSAHGRQSIAGRERGKLMHRGGGGGGGGGSAHPGWRVGRCKKGRRVSACAAGHATLRAKHGTKRARATKERLPDPAYAF
jgi:hypothetical protein